MKRNQAMGYDVMSCVALKCSLFFIEKIGNKKKLGFFLILCKR